MSDHTEQVCFKATGESRYVSTSLMPCTLGSLSVHVNTSPYLSYLHA